ncbi:MAG: hypothetical protein IJM10_00400 [Clostridia bacterium]|nr:hypothetical protein [Clostridia bacterium]
MKFATNTTSSGTITIGASDGTLTVTVGSGLTYSSGDGTTFAEQCGVDTAKKTQSTLVYTITITNNNGSPTFSMTSNAG